MWFANVVFIFIVAATFVTFVKTKICFVLSVTFIKNIIAMKKISIAFLLFFGITQSVIAQTESGIYGTVNNQLKVPLAGITVYLLDSNHQQLANTLTDVNGAYGFAIADAANYGLIAAMSDSNYQSINQIVAYPNAININFVFSGKTIKHDRNSDVISAKELERMPNQSLNAMLSTKGNFDKDANGQMRSRASGKGVKVIVDGQIMNDNFNQQIVPNSINSLEVIQR
jgi:hypothetical protein